MRRESYLASLIVLLLAGALAAGCASTSKMAAPSPVGEWTYFIPNTPQGDVRGTIMVALEDDAYSGEMYLDILECSSRATIASRKRSRLATVAT